MDSIVFVHVFHVIHWDKWIIDCHNVDIGLVSGSTHDHASSIVIMIKMIKKN
jgi:hypothetical protein